MASERLTSLRAAAARHLTDLARTFASTPFTDSNRSIRMRLGGPLQGLDGLLFLQRADIHESICGGLQAQLTCLGGHAELPLESLIGLPVEAQLVTDRGQLRRFCMIVTEVRAGQSDGGWAIYQLTGLDALSIKRQGSNSRVFRFASVLDISHVMLKEWLQQSAALARAFDFDVSKLESARYPKREFTLQYNQSDADFLCSLWRQAGIGWFIEPVEAAHKGAAPQHRLMLFDDSMRLDESPAGDLRYHRDAATEQRDAITLWAPARRLIPASLERRSWDYIGVGTAEQSVPTLLDQGQAGDDLATAVRDARIEIPHAGDDVADHRRLSRLRMERHEYAAQCVQGVSSVRDLAPGHWNAIAGRPELDRRPTPERQYVFVEVHHLAQNNLPKALNERAQSLLAASEKIEGWSPFPHDGDEAGAKDTRYRNRFAAVRRGLPIVPASDPRTDRPRMHPLTALVVGPPGEEVHCDALGRVKVQFQGFNPKDHDHASGAGTSGGERDSAWLRVGCGWAGAGFGNGQSLRIGMEVIVDFLDGHPDRPIIIGAVYNGRNAPPRFDHVSRLPGDRALSGFRSKELFGARANQLRFDDTPGQINAQLASEHGHSQLNLGHLTQPRSDGDAAPRGEGAELRSDQALAARGERGVLISADRQPRAGGEMLERSALIGMAELMQGVLLQLNDMASKHHAHTADAAKLAQILSQLQAWDNGCNTRPQAEPSTAAMVAVSAPAGIALASQDNLLLGAQSHIDAVSGGHVQISAGRRVLLRCAERFSAFAHKGIELIAAQGKLDLQAHQDSIELSAAKRIVLTAGAEIVLQAPSVRLVGKGAQVEIGGGRIELQSAGDFTARAGSFAFAGPGGGDPQAPQGGTSSLRTDERFVLRMRGSNAPIVDRGYRISLDNGQVVQGRTDAQGCTQLPQSDAWRMARIEVLDD